MTAAFLAWALTASQAQGLPLKPGEVDCSAGFRNARSEQLRPRKMTDLPPADMELAIDRRIGRCRVPVIIVRDVEAGGAPPLKREDAPSNRR